MCVSLQRAVQEWSGKTPVPFWMLIGAYRNTASHPNQMPMFFLQKVMNSFVNTAKNVYNWWRLGGLIHSL